MESYVHSQRYPFNMRKYSQQNKSAPTITQFVACTSIWVQSQVHSIHF